IDPSGHLRMVVDNPLHAANTLREQHYNVEERDVIYTTMPNEPGSLSRALRLIGEAGINVDYAYASGIDRVPMVGVVIAVADAQKAAYVAGL
ncbi:MAG TPA: ACT domain-containing protein, partial [Vicinamibacterales bacterium]|nr:ACT domain-containing protein [Vicinamibacterales bacterium]